jgi:V/A-type H+-transporting ATPase subunit I
MIVKMKFVNISGPRHDIDRVTDLYLSRYEIQLESALSELKTVDNLTPFLELNPYRDALAKAIQFVGYLENPERFQPDTTLGLDDLFRIIQDTNQYYVEVQTKRDELKKEINTLQQKQQLLLPFRTLDCTLRDVLKFKYIEYQFGKLPIDAYRKFETYLQDDLSAIFVESMRDDSFVYGVYYVSPGDSQKAESILRSLHFEKIKLPSDLQETPSQEYHKLSRKIHNLNKKIQDLDKELTTYLTERAPKLVTCRKRLDELAHNFDIRKMAAHMKDKKEDYYILCGWMSEDDIDDFLEAIKDDDKIFVIVEDSPESHFGEPPVKLKNPKIFQPFEMFIEMYGLPSHDEFDPTVLVGFTYSLIFGVMFGDVGQGLLLLIVSALIYRIKKNRLAGIISCAAVFSTFFGFMFGSVFGFEDIIDAVWLRPINHMTVLPFIGKLNTVFVISVAFGMLTILVAMILQTINSIRTHDVENIWFSPNGIAGLVFYASITVTVVLFMTGNPVPGNIVMLVMFGIPLLLILFREPLTRLIEKESKLMEEGAGMFLVQGFFELFETLLSYFSNTLSFVRIGAFAVSHAAIMEVVLLLANVESGNPNWAVVVLGNLFVCGFEGLIVGIQVLRLEYYELFSRFYKGNGRAFHPYTHKNK